MTSYKNEKISKKGVTNSSFFASIYMKGLKIKKTFDQPSNKLSAKDQAPRYTNPIAIYEKNFTITRPKPPTEKMPRPEPRSTRDSGRGIFCSHLI